MSKYNVATIELIATYEEVNNISQSERVTAYFGDYDMHYLVNDVDVNKAVRLRDEALKAMGMTHEEFLSNKDFIYRQNIRLKMREGLMAGTIKENDSVMFVSPQPMRGMNKIEILKGIITSVNAETKGCTVDFEEHKIDISFRNILGIENDNVQGKNFGFDNCKSLLGARESDADELIKEAIETMKINDKASEKFEVIVIFDKPVLFTCERLNRNPPIDGVHYYDIRHDDEGRGDMVQLKDGVMVNHWGTVLSKEKFEPREQGGRMFTTEEGIDIDEDDYNYTGETLSVSEYLEKYDELMQKYCEPKEENHFEMGM